MNIKNELNGRSALGLIAAAGLTLPAGASVIDFQMGDANGTTHANISDSGTTGVSFPSGLNSGGNVTTNGSGLLVFTQGTGGGPGNAFGGTTPFVGLTTGVYELEFEFVDSSMTGADSATVKYGLRTGGSGGSQELFRVGLDRSGGTMSLQLEIGASDIDLVDFAGNALAGALNVRAIIDLDADLVDVIWSGAATGSSLDNPVADQAVDQIQVSAFLGSLDPTDTVNVDFVTLSVVPEPASLTLVGAGVIAGLRRRRNH